MQLGEEKILEFLKLKIVNVLLEGIRLIAQKLLVCQARYSAEEAIDNVSKGEKFDLRGMKNRVKNAIIHDQEIIDKRWAECEKCEFLKAGEKLGKKYHQCLKCGCFMKIGDKYVKTRIATQGCPIGKWHPEYEFIKGKAVNGSQPVVK